MINLCAKIGKLIRNPKEIIRHVFQSTGLSSRKSTCYKDWETRGFAAPSPHFIKQAVLLRNGLSDATWVETGTFLGETTRVLSKVANFVYSIEPEPKLYARAERKFRRTPNVEIIRGTSEQALPALLPKLSGDICFWLDGHYSAGATFKGPQDTPIIDELNNVEGNINRFGRIVVMVDDIRCFDPDNPEYSTYPPVDYLIDWARKTGLHWNIEHDIFIARNYRPDPTDGSVGPRLSVDEGNATGA
jgi:hypothetical protein